MKKESPQERIRKFNQKVYETDRQMFEEGYTLKVLWKNGTTTYENKEPDKEAVLQILDLNEVFKR